MKLVIINAIHDDLTLFYSHIAAELIGKQTSGPITIKALLLAFQMQLYGSSIECNAYVVGLFTPGIWHRKS